MFQGYDRRFRADDDLPEKEKPENPVLCPDTEPGHHLQVLQVFTPNFQLLLPN